MSDLLVTAGEILNSDAVKMFGGFIAGAYSDTAKDLAGIGGGNQVKRWSMDQMDWLAKASEARLAEKKLTKADQLPPSIGVPLLQAAIMESREEIVKLWVDLLTAAISHERGNHVRLSFIEIIKKMDPLDAVIFDAIGRKEFATSGRLMSEYFVMNTKRSDDDIQVTMRICAL